MSDLLRRDMGGNAPVDSHPRPLAEDSHGQAEASEPALYFASADQWLNEWMLQAWMPPTTTTSYKWCNKWWLHPEAVHRIEILWRSWEHYRTDGLNGMSVWWRDHFDHHWNQIINPRGPFEQCKPGLHREAAQPLTAIPSPVLMNDYVMDDLP